MEEMCIVLDRDDKRIGANSKKECKCASFVPNRSGFFHSCVGVVCAQDLTPNNRAICKKTRKGIKGIKEQGNDGLRGKTGPSTRNAEIKKGHATEQKRSR